MLFMMFSNQIHSFTQYMSLGEQVRMIGQSGRFPTQQLVDTYEMKMVNVLMRLVPGMILRNRLIVVILV